MKCPHCDKEINLLEWQLNDLKRILSKSEEEFEKEKESFVNYFKINMEEENK